MARTYVKNEVPTRTDFQGLSGVYCRTCGREIWRQANPQVRTVTKCQICILKEQGVPDAEEHVLTQYYMSNDPTRIPTPIDADMSLEGGILLLNQSPDQDSEKGRIPQTGGLFGTVRSLFKVFGFEQKEAEVPVSKEIAKRKRTGGLYDERIK
jgi:hypothetical protein